MDAEGFWRLFWATGLPEAYLLACLLRQAEEEGAGEPKSA